VSKTGWLLRLGALMVCIAGAVLAQSTSAVFDDFSLGNRTHNGSPNNQLWSLIGGGVTGSYNWQTLTFPGSAMVIDHSRPASEAPIAITNLTSGMDGFVRVWAPHNGYLVNVSRSPVQVSGVTTCTGAKTDCGSTGYWMGAEVDYAFTAPMSGATATAPGHGLQNGDTAILRNCVENPSLNNHVFTVANVTSSTFSLSGFTGPACGTEAWVADDMRFDLVGSTFSPSFAAPSGTVIRVASGFDVGAIFTPHQTYPNDWVAGNLMPGQTWNPDFNRMRFDVTCNYQIIFPRPVGGNGYNLGTYVRTQNIGYLQGMHFYHQFAGNQYANHTMHFEAMRTPEHSTSTGLIDAGQFLEDPTYTSGIYQDGKFHYFDGLNDFYINYGPYALAQWAAGGVCQIQNIRFALVTGEADTWVSTVQASYTGSAYEVSWNQPGVIPGGATYDVRYATDQSCHTKGFSQCTVPNGGTGSSVTGLDNTGYSDILWTSPNMSEQSNIWIAIRPHMRIQAVTGADGKGPFVITPYNGHDMQAGDTVAVAGVTNVPDGSYTITPVAPAHFSNPSGSISSLVVAGGVATVTTAAAHGLRSGQVVQVAQSSTDANLEANRVVVTVTGPNTFTFPTSAVAGSYPNSTNPLLVITSLPALALNGTTSSGKAGASAGTATPTTDTTNFYEIQIPAQGSPLPVVTPPPSSSPSPTTFSACDLNKDGVVNSQDVQLMVNVALGQAACTSSFDLNGDGLCNVVDVQRVINAADGGSCVTGQ